MKYIHIFSSVFLKSTRIKKNKIKGRLQQRMTMERIFKRVQKKLKKLLKKEITKDGKEKNLNEPH